MPDRASPGFCFDADGRPRAVIVAVRKAIGDRLTGWALAAWLVSPCPDLDGARPVDLLEDSPDRVVTAAAAAGCG